MSLRKQRLSVVSFALLGSLVLPSITSAKDTEDEKSERDQMIDAYLQVEMPTWIAALSRAKRSDFEDLAQLRSLDSGHHLVNVEPGLESVVYQRGGLRRVFYPDDFSFQVLPGSLGQYFSLDKHYLYFQGIAMQTSAPGLELLAEQRSNISQGGVVWKTKLKVFLNDVQVDVADPSTFRRIPGEGHLGFMDKDHIYYWGTGTFEQDPEHCDHTCYAAKTLSHNGYLLAIPKHYLRPINDWLFVMNRVLFDGVLVDANLRKLPSTLNQKAIRKISQDYAYNDEYLIHKTKLYQLSQKRTLAARLSQLDEGIRKQDPDAEEEIEDGCRTPYGHYVKRGFYWGANVCKGQNLWLERESSDCAHIGLHLDNIKPISYWYAVDDHRVFFINRQRDCPLIEVRRADPNDFRPLEGGQFAVSSRFLYYQTQFILENEKSLEYLAAYRSKAPQGCCHNGPGLLPNAYLFRNRYGYWLFLESEGLRQLYMGHEPDPAIFPFLPLKLPNERARAAAVELRAHASTKVTKLDGCDIQLSVGGCYFDREIAAKECRLQRKAQRAKGRSGG